MKLRTALLPLLLAACRAAEPAAPPLDAAPVSASSRIERPSLRNDVIVVCGERVPIGVPVVLWTERGGYDAYSTELRFPSEPPKELPEGLRYQPGRKVAKGDGTTRLTSLSGTPACGDELRAALDQFVIHYDVCGTSRQCFKILHDRRKLSVHFLLDVDGTLYQTLDLSDTANHARQSNSRSVGI